MWKKQNWVDDDGSLTVGTPFTAARMNNAEEGIGEKKLAIDGSLEGSTEGATLTLEYTPSAEKIQGVLVMLAQDFVTSTAMGAPAVQVGETNVTTTKLIGTLENASRGAMKLYFCTSRGMFQKNSSGKIPVFLSGMKASTKKRAMAFFFTGPGPLRATGKPETSNFASTNSAEIKAPEEAAGNENIMLGVAQTGKKPTRTGGEQFLQVEMGTNDWLSIVGSQERYLRGVGVERPKITLTTTENTTWNVFSIGIAPIHDWGEVLILPAGAGIGDVCHFVADATNNIVWDLEYDGRNETYPWRKIGGASMRKVEATNRESGTGGTIETTGAPSLTTPLKGEYRGHYGATSVQIIGAGSSPTTQATCLLYINGVNVDSNVSVGTFQFEGSPLGSGFETKAIESGKTVQTRYSSNNGRNWNFNQLFVEIDPIRVG